MRGQGLLVTGGTFAVLGLALGALVWLMVGDADYDALGLTFFFTLAGAALGIVGLLLVGLHAILHPAARWASCAMLGGVLFCMGLTVLILLLRGLIPGYAENCTPGGRRDYCSIAQALVAKSWEGLALGTAVALAALLGGGGLLRWGLKRQPKEPSPPPPRGHPR